jgi:hypothetical protein
MRCSLNFAVSAMALGLTVACVSARAQAPEPYSGVGKTPTQQEISAWDVAVGVEGKELPPGSGTAKEGAQVFAAKCAMCHGEAGEGKPGIGPNLVGGVGSLSSDHPVRTVGSFLAYATTLWDYINRAMPWSISPRRPDQNLKPDEVYKVTAFILYKNGIVKEDDVLDAKTLPKVQMPNRNGFLPARLDELADLQKRGCHQGQCPESTSRK